MLFSSTLGMTRTSSDSASDGDGRWRDRGRHQSQHRHSTSYAGGDGYESEVGRDRHHHRRHHHTSQHHRRSWRSRSPRRERRHRRRSRSSSSESSPRPRSTFHVVSMAAMDACPPLQKVPCPCRRCKGVVDQDGSTIMTHCGTHGRYVPPTQVYSLS